MSDLTEQWKKGELPSGWYYTKLWKGYYVIDKFIGNQFLRYDDSDIVEVIAPVPSYEEWQAKLEENTKLKELLKDCREYVKKDYGDYLTYTQSAIYQEINQALGED